jgi:hypothetical protein
MSARDRILAKLKAKNAIEPSSPMSPWFAGHRPVESRD